MTNGHDSAFSRPAVFGDDEDHPGNIATYEDGADGLTKREYFAAMVMQANFSNVETLRAYSTQPGDLFRVVAHASVQQADALIEALNRPMCPDCKTRFADDGHYDTTHKICPDYERAMSERESA